MADTARNITALKALMADNTTGDISPQDLRDFLVSCLNIVETSLQTMSGPLTVTGTCTATTFSGSGASLTSIPAGNLTGTIADARQGANVALLNDTDVTFAGSLTAGTLVASGSLSGPLYISSLPEVTSITSSSDWFYVEADGQPSKISGTNLLIWINANAAIQYSTCAEAYELAVPDGVSDPIQVDLEAGQSFWIRCEKSGSGEYQIDPEFTFDSGGYSNAQNYLGPDCDNLVTGLTSLSMCAS